MFSFDHEISSDLEWMLQSGHATTETLLEALVPEYYPHVYRLALAWLGDLVLARQAARETFVQAVLHLHTYRQDLGVRAWIFREAAAANKRTTSRLKNGLSGKPTLGEAADATSAIPASWAAFDALPVEQRQCLLLSNLSGLSPHEIAIALNLKEKEIVRRLQAALDGLGEHAGWRESSLADVVMLDWLQQRYPVPETTPAELSEVAAWAAQQSAGRSLRRRLAAHAKEIAFLAIGLVLAVAVIWLASDRLFGNEPAAEYSPPGPTPVPRQSALYLAQPGDAGQELSGLLGLSSGSLPGAGGVEQPGQAIEIPLDVFSTTLATAAPLPDPPKAPALSSSSDSDAIRQRLEESTGLWRTLWLQVESLDYGPVGYIGPPVGSRSQAWISQPGQSLELLGQLDGQVDRIHLVDGGRQYHATGNGGALYLEPWGDSDPLLQDETLRSLADPSAGPWMQPGGVFEAVESSKEAGRSALVVDWRNPLSGERQYRLWLDARTGSVLHLQQYGGGDGQTLLRDVLVTGANFDRDFPQELFDPQTAGLQGFAQDEQGASQRFAQSSVLAPQARPSLPYTSPPANLDLARSPLVFQFPIDLTATALYSESQTIPADLFAGGFYLGRVPFSLPWSVICARSPDGQRLAYATLDSAAQPSGRVGWFNLAEIDKVYFPAPGFTAQAIAFAPDNQRLAVIGQEAQAGLALYLMDLATGELENILPVGAGSSLVWSPDGRYVALLGKDDPRYSESRMMVVNLDTHQVVYSEPYVPGQPAPADSPMAAWGVTFPLPGDLYPCAAPRQ